MDLIVKQAQDVATVSPQRIEELVDSFINSQDVKLSSKLLYRRTLKQYFNWVDKKSYLLSEIARPQLLEYKEELLNSNMSSLTVGSYITSVRRFYEWTEANKYYPNVAKGIKTLRENSNLKNSLYYQLRLQLY
jgi:integrase/recombinase XerD